MNGDAEDSRLQKTQNRSKGRKIKLIKLISTKVSRKIKEKVFKMILIDT